MRACVFVCVCVYPEIQSCEDSGGPGLVPDLHPVLCEGLCGPDAQHTDAGRREHYERQEGARNTPPWALVHVTQTQVWIGWTEGQTKDRLGK